MPTSAQRSSPGPVFIVGCPRSGTTLLACMLDRHEAIAVPPETRFFAEAIPWLRRTRSALTTPQLCDALLRRNRVRDLALTRRDVEPHLTSARPPDRELFQAILTAYARRRGKTMWIEKTPDHLLHLPTLLSWYPDARVLCMVRDGRDVCMSLMRVPWTHASLVRHCFTWMEYAQRAAVCAQDHRDRLRIVHYEQLLGGPEQVMRDVCRFIGVPYSSRLIAGGAPSATVPAWETAWKARAHQPPDVQRSGAWRREATGAQRALMNYVMERELARWGYPPERPSALARVWLPVRLAPFHPAIRPLAAQALRRAQRHGLQLDVFADRAWRPAPDADS